MEENMTKAERYSRLVKVQTALAFASRDLLAESDNNFKWLDRAILNRAYSALMDLQIDAKPKV